jgi:hypothetical protein
MRVMETTTRYWFPAKRYGWGWGLPSAWQGWLVLAAYLAVITVPAVLLPEEHVGWLLAVVLVATPLLVWVCWRKGEPPHHPPGGQR